jgi:hypothetical protein
MHKLTSSQRAGLSQCDTDPIGGIKNMFVDIIQGNRVMDGQCPVRRAVFNKLHGGIKTTFEVNQALAPASRIGVFKYDKLDAWIRFSSDTKPGFADLKTTLGIGVKLFGVAGDKLLEGDEKALTADFILQNHDVFFVDTAKDMCEFTYAGVINHDYGPYLDAHEDTANILNDMKKEVKSVLGTNYWSCLPYSFGDKYVKYKIAPLNVPVLPPIPANNPNYLRDELQQHLLQQEVRFGFYLQFQQDEESMPIDKATVRWDEQVSVPQLFATLILHQQNIDDQGQLAYAENLAFNPWHTLPEHQPAGSISDARRVAYKASADQRRLKNGIAACEPYSPR